MSRKPTRLDLYQRLLVSGRSRVRLLDRNARSTPGWEDKDEAEQALQRNRVRLAELQEKMYADGRFGLLIVLQGIDGGGKDGTVRHVIGGFDPQGCTVTAFKAPSPEELRHDYLWRVHRHTPRRGEVAAFNRSHYEDVIVPRAEKLVAPRTLRARYGQINDFERMLHENDIRVVKFFLHISKAEQKTRFEARLCDPRKQWKFDPADLEKRKRWEEYRAAFEAMLVHCNTAWAPWYVIPSDRKWFRNLAVSEILVRQLEKLPLRYPRRASGQRSIRIR